MHFTIAFKQSTVKGFNNAYFPWEHIRRITEIGMNVEAKVIVRTLGWMPDDSSNPEPYPAHVYRNCARDMLRSEMDSYASISGVVLCPVCSKSGSLKIEIRSPDEKKPPAGSDGES